MMTKKLFIFSSTLFKVKESRLVLHPRAVRSLVTLSDYDYIFYIILENNLQNSLGNSALTTTYENDLKYLRGLFENEGIYLKMILEENLGDGLLKEFDSLKNLDELSSFVIASFDIFAAPDETAVKLSEQLEVKLIFYEDNWLELARQIINRDRIVKLERKTKETEITVEINLDGSGQSKVETGLNFFDHMLDNFSKHSGVDLDLMVKGDLEVDEHHTIEDTAITLAAAFKKAWADKRGVLRYAFVLPMDESETYCSIDLSGRGHLEWSAKFSREYVGDFPTELLQHFYYSFCINAGVNMNMKILGKNEHHMIESSFKSFAKCIKQAVKREGNDLPSTKGIL